MALGTPVTCATITTPRSTRSPPPTSTSSSRVALQDRQPRPAPRVQARRHAADRQRLLYATGGTRRSVVALDGGTGELIWVHSREKATRGHRAAPALGPRRLVLDRRQGRRPHRLRHDRLPPHRAEREDRPRRSRRFGTGGVVDLKVGMVTGTASRSISRPGEIGIHSTPPSPKHD